MYIGEYWSDPSPTDARGEYVHAEQHGQKQRRIPASGHHDGARVAAYGPGPGLSPQNGETRPAISAI